MTAALDWTQLLTVIAPIVVAAVGGLFGYRQAVRVADKNQAVEGRKLNLTEYEALNKGLQAEIDRLRTDRQEDEDRFERRIGVHEGRIDRLERQRTEAEAALLRMIGWARHLLSTLRRPDVSRALDDLGVAPLEPPDIPGGADQFFSMPPRATTRDDWTRSTGGDTHG